ncbi:MAG TPA: CDP-diacylglycerol--glycerol-3-phosphate 3-phosphatidyltransferase [Anaeromyxobacteraceae bacterium]|nr:CDP-diacylglycerol--glycerol-3-phosphate 3-phosphatidyltransferase [Anaeromyxobacteraceae bacterium]
MPEAFKRDLWNVPNAITLVRIAAIPVFLVFTYYESRLNSFIAALVYALTAATDFLDGYLARRMNLVTVIGKFLDPLADKLIAMSALVMLVHLGRVGAWVVILLLTREFAVTGLRTIAMSEGIVIAAGQEGKYKTALQLAAIVFLLLHYRYPIDFLVVTLDVDANRVGTLLLYVSVVFSVWSAIVYTRGFLKVAYAKPPSARSPGPAAPTGARPEGVRTGGTIGRGTEM